jgi:hypothetical protein
MPSDQPEGLSLSPYSKPCPSEGPGLRGVTLRLFRLYCGEPSLAATCPHMRFERPTRVPSDWMGSVVGFTLRAHRQHGSGGHTHDQDASSSLVGSRRVDGRGPYRRRTRVGEPLHERQQETRRQAFRSSSTETPERSSGSRTACSIASTEVSSTPTRAKASRACWASTSTVMPWQTSARTSWGRTSALPEQAQTQRIAAVSWRPSASEAFVPRSACRPDRAVTRFKPSDLAFGRSRSKWTYCLSSRRLTRRIDELLLRAGEHTGASTPPRGVGSFVVNLRSGEPLNRACDDASISAGGAWR